MSKNLLHHHNHHNQQNVPAEAEQNRDGDQELRSLGETFTSWLPTSSNTFF